MLIGIIYNENSILEKIRDERVFEICLSDDNTYVNIGEKCDDFFNIDLTKKEVIQLLDEIKEILNQMKD